MNREIDFFRNMFSGSRKLAGNATQIYKHEIAHGNTVPWFAWTVIGFFLCYLSLLLYYHVHVTALLCPLFALPVFYVLTAYAIKKTERINLFRSSENIRILPEWKITLLITLFYWILTAMTGIVHSPDTENQWAQVVSGCFDDWHPVIHTGCIWLIAQIYQSDFFVVLVSELIFAFLCGRVYTVLLKSGYKKSVAYWILGIMVFSPVTVSYMRVLWKDIAFAFSVLGIYVVMIEILRTKGKSLSRITDFTILLFLIFMSSFLRHNGIFFSIPLLFLLPFACHAKQRITAVILVCISFLTIGGYIFLRSEMIKNGTILQEKSQTFCETVGIPMTMMTECFVNKRDSLPDDIQKFFTDMAPAEFIEECYTGDFNSLKFRLPEHNKAFSSTINNITPCEFLAMWIRTAVSAPVPSIKAFRRVTGYGIDPAPGMKNFQPLYSGRIIGDTVIGFLSLSLIAPFGYLLAAPGMSVLLLLFAGIIGFLRYGAKILPFFIPLICYNWGTTLLLCGNDHRFFYAVLLAAPLAITVCINPPSETE